MPFATIQTTTGPADFEYIISTPSCDSATCIDRDVPTVLFLHPLFMGPAIFHSQLADPNLRRFNLIAISARSHGQTHTRPEKGFGPKAAADDIHKIMECLQLPPCHVLGLSIGSSIALELAVAHPEKVLSLCMTSPIAFEESQEVFDGRGEILTSWRDAFLGDPDNTLDALAHAMHGGMQLMFNNMTSSEIKALQRYYYSVAMEQYGYNNLDDLTILMVDFFLEPRSKDHSLSKIQCPVKLIRFTEDLVYSPEDAEATLAMFTKAGVNASSQTLEGIQYGCYTHPEEFNNVLHEFLLSALDGPPSPIPGAVTSPFEEALRKLGWGKDSDSDSDNDDSDIEEDSDSDSDS